MKSLVQYIKEAQGESTSVTKSLALNFDGLEESEKVISSLQEKGESTGIPVSVDDKKVTIELSSETFDKATEIKTILDSYVKTCNDSGKRSSDEAYAQKLQAFEKEVNKFTELEGEISAAKAEEEQSSKKTEDEKTKEGK